MRPFLLFLTSRAVLAWTLAAVVMLLAGLAVGDRVLVVQVRSDATRSVMLLEIVGALGASALPALAAPRLWSWERGGCRLALHAFAAALALVVMLVPPVVIGICSLRLDLTPERLAAISVNTAMIAGVSASVVVLRGPAPASALASATYGLLTLAAAVSPVRIEVLASGAVAASSLVLAALTCVAGIGLHSYWLGRAPWVDY